MSNTKAIPWPKNGTWPHECECCSDSGLVGGTDYPASFCKCKAGKKLEIDNPHAAAEANAVREKLGIQ